MYKATYFTLLCFVCELCFSPHLLCLVCDVILIGYHLGGKPYENSNEALVSTSVVVPLYSCILLFLPLTFGEPSYCLQEGRWYNG